MSAENYELESHRGGSRLMTILSVVTVLYVVSAGSLAILAFNQNPDISIVEAIGMGFVGVGGIIVAGFAAIIGIVIGLIGAVFGIAVGGGAIAVTLFVLASPVIALVLFALLMRRGRDCPDPSRHM